MKFTFNLKVFSIAMGLSALCLFSCSEEATDTDKLADIIDKYEGFKLYDDKKFPLGIHSDSIEGVKARFAKELLNELDLIDISVLSETESISTELLKFKLSNTLDEYEFQMHLNPIQADQGFHLNLNYRIRPILNLRDATRYLKVLGAIPEFTDQHIKLLKESLKRGISQPKVIFDGYETTYNQHIVNDVDSSAFFEPFEKLPKSISKSSRDSLKTIAEQLIHQKVIPSFERIKDFFETTYIPETRETVGISEVPNGRQFYQNRVNYYTTSEAYTADSIHKIGLAEVSRIRLQMQSIINELNFNGTFEEFLAFLRTENRFYAKSGEELLTKARDIAKRIDAELPKFFKTLPRRPYGVKKVPDAIAPKYTGGRYSGPSKDTEPGYYLVNTYKLSSRPLYVLPALTAHEAVPGHHLQGSLNSELGDSIPSFRKNTYLSAYGEGWALYTEFLADEMNIYTTPYEQFGKLTYEMWRACRLVVDTGIHDKGWTRQRAIDYMLANTALSEHEVNTETDRYIAWPGQALSYKMGELKIRELRVKAEQELGSAFDIKDFHEIILNQGTVTLPILERRILTYIRAKK